MISWKTCYCKLNGVRHGMNFLNLILDYVNWMVRLLIADFKM